MKAKLKPRINLEGRTPLETVIPLSVPMVLFVDPVSTCNFRCKFCPTGDRELIDKTGRYQGRLDYAVFTKVIDDLKEFDRPIKVLRMYKEGEPLLHTRFADMVKYAKDSGYVEFIDTTTNGYLLTPTNSLRIIKAGIDRINISIDGLSDEQYLEFTQTKVNFNQLVENIRFLYEHKGECEICIKVVGDILSETDKKRFFDIFGDIADRVSIENIAPCWPEFDIEEHTGVEITEGIYGQDIAETKVCPYIFYSMAVNSDGTVSLCFLDWARKLNIGDAKKQSLKDIWQGDAIFNHQLQHLQGNRKKNSVCRDCGQLTHCLPDNIDRFSAELEQKIKVMKA